MQEFDFEPGPKLGQILKELEYAIVDGRLPNDLGEPFTPISRRRNERFYR